uniref:SH3 domain-containing protein n=1 Tax=Oncorhynchus tshawytscha TaxID=74940 RepID=A0AAZ3SIG2_ONCTS
PLSLNPSSLSLSPSTPSLFFCSLSLTLSLLSLLTPLLSPSTPLSFFFCSLSHPLSPPLSPHLSLLSLNPLLSPPLSPLSPPLSVSLSLGNSKQGLRCRTCKMGAHLWCTSELSQQPCNGKSGVGVFKRNFSTPMLVNEQLTVVKEVQPTQGRGRGVDPIYAALRYGTSLAQMSRSSFGSVSESPTHSQLTLCSETLYLTKTFFRLYSFSLSVSIQVPRRVEWGLFGKSGDKVGFFPANFVQRVRPGERVWRVTQPVPASRGMGHMPVKEDQICVGKSEDGEGFLKLSSGKKRGLVPAKSIEEI